MAGYAQTVMMAMVLCCSFTGTAQALAVLQITGVSDFTLPNWGIGDPAPSAHIDLCVYSVGTNLSGGYAVTATGSNGFTLSSSGNQLPYALYWEDDGAGSLGTTAGTQLTSGAQLGNQLNANILSAACALGLTGPNARLTLKINQSDLTAALAGTYTGAVTLLIAPN